MASIRDSLERILARRAINLDVESSLDITFSDLCRGVAFTSIASHLPQWNGVPLFARELKDTVVDPDLNVWLALVGGGRILETNRPDSYLTGTPFPLYNFSGIKPGTAPVYILAGFDSDIDLQVAVSRDASVTWHRTKEPQGMPGIREFYFEPAEVGTQLVSFKVAERSPYTVATVTNRNRATFITLTLFDDLRLNIGQYLLPIGALVEEMPQRVERYFRQTSLTDILFLARAAKAFRDRQDLSDLHHQELNELLYHKWLDPIGCAMAAYEFIRRGKETKLGEVVKNMQKYFPDFPDTAALARLSGKQARKRVGVPLFSDGLEAFPHYEKWLPLAANHRDFESPWTAWRSAVKTN
jgi:hypothetical protein